MILQINGGNMLELFWRQPGVRSWTHRAASDFLSRYVTRKDGLRGLRKSLSQRSGASSMLNARTSVVIHRGASLITSGDLVVAQARFTKRVPGTGNVLGSRWNSVLLLRPEKLHTAPDIETALNWLNRIKTVAEKVEKASEDKNSDKKKLKEDERELADYYRELDLVRELAASGPGVPDFSHLKPGDFIEQLERVIQSGLLIPIYHRPAGVIESIPGAPPPSEQPALRAGPDREQAPDPNTFDSDHEAFAQGNTLTEAAEDGVPFCEVCAREAAKAR